MFYRSQRHFHVRNWRRNDADEVHVIASHQFAPIFDDVGNLKFFGNIRGMVWIAAGDCDHTRAHAVAKSGNLSRASKPRPNDPNTNRFTVSHNFTESALVKVGTSSPSDYMIGRFRAMDA